VFWTVEMPQADSFFRALSHRSLAA
jgi:hypothetical protein